MATATQQRQTANGTTRQQDDSLLDRAVEATERKQSVIRGAASILGIQPDKLIGVLQNVWKTSKDQPPLTADEMFVGISMIARYELDPIAREVYVTRGKGGIFTIISIDGWIKVLDRTDHYDGFDVEFGYKEDGSIEWVETTIHSTKRRHPAKYRAFADEYAKLGGMVAKIIPTHMLRIFSLRHAARLFTPIGGSVVTEEEALFLQREKPQEERQQVTPEALRTKLAPRQIVEQEAADELPETSYEPTTATQQTASEMSLVDQFTAEASECDTARAVATLTDNWIGPGSARELTPEDQEAIQNAAAKRIGELKTTKGDEGRDHHHY